MTLLSETLVPVLMIWNKISSVFRIAQKRIFAGSLNKLHETRGAMAKQLQNAQTICGSRIGLDTENDDIMIWVTQRSWSPVPDNDQETVCWFEPFVDQVSPCHPLNLDSDATGHSFREFQVVSII